MTEEQLLKLPALVEMLKYFNQSKAFGQLFDAHQSLAEELDQQLGLDPTYSARVHEQYKEIQALELSAKQRLENLLVIKQDIKNEIESMVPSLTSTEWFKERLGIDSNVRKKWFLLDFFYTETIVEVGRIKDIWKYPVACINVQHFRVIDIMLQADYVYLIDDDQELLDARLEQVDLGVKIRVKPYRLKDFNNLKFDTTLGRVRTELRWGIPKQQLAVAICPNIFERYTIDHMKTQLEEIKTLMRPGGKIMFNVTNAETPPGARDVVIGSSSYVTKDLLNNLLESLDLTMEKWEPINNYTSMFVVAKMPGTLASAKFQPSRASIKKS